MINSYRKRTSAGRGAVLTMGFAIVAISQAVSAATITVTTTSDTPAPGECSLREALEAANTDTAVGSCAAGSGPGDTVMVPAGNYVFSTASELNVLDDTDVTGAGAASTTIDANGLSRVFSVRNSTSTIEGLTITGGSSSNDGGGINSESSQLTVRDSVVTANSSGSDGGGIDSDDGGNSLTLIRTEVSNNTSASEGGGIRLDNSDTTLSITDSTVTGNTADTEGGGIHIDNTATVTITGSTISGNTTLHTRSIPCDQGGGGISQDSGGVDSSLTITNSTISGNSAPNSCGGGIFVLHSMELRNVTIVDNSAPSGGGGNVYRRDDNEPLEVSNSIVANAASGGDCATSGATPVFNTGGGNIDSDDSCGFSAGTDQPGVNPLLGPLSANGGTTLTHMPQSGSPAIDGGVNASCEDSDQRGVSRPLDGTGNGTATCDAGAVEVDGQPSEPREIPVLGGWMLALLSGLFALSGLIVQRRRLGSRA